MTTLERVGVASLVEKMVEARLRWFGHVERSVDFVVKSLEAKGDLEKLKRETIQKDLEINELDRNMIHNRTLW